MKINYFIVAPSKWTKDSILYRRNKLATYLASKKETNNIYWIYSTEFFSENNELRVDEFENIKITQIGIKNISKNFDIFPLKIAKKTKVNYFLRKNVNEKNILIYTVPRFTKLSHLKSWDSIVYDCSDLWVRKLNVKHPIKKIIYSGKEKIEKKIVLNSNLIFSTSSFLKERIEREFSKEVFLIENGVDDNLVSDQSSLGILNEKYDFGFVGTMKSDKINFELLYKVFNKMNQWSLLLVGPSPAIENISFNKLIELNNVTFTGRVSSDKAAEYIKCITVGLLPYNNNDYTKAVFPLKFNEYLAAGKPIVGCCLPSLKYKTEEGIYYHSDDMETNFLENCIECLNLDQRKYYKKRQKLSSQAKWSIKFEKFYEKITKNIGVL